LLPTKVAHEKKTCQNVQLSKEDGPSDKLKKGEVQATD